MMRVALTCSNDATTPEAQLSLQGNKRAQNEANGTRRVPAYTWNRPSIVDDAGPAGLNAVHVDALNDPAVRKQLENLGLQMPPKDKFTPEALGA